MATHDYVIDNSTGANVRSDINNVLQAILTNNSSSSAPSTTAAYMWWADTTTGILKIRNSANDGWVELLQLDGTLTLEDGSASNPALAFRDDLNTGIFSSAADKFEITTGGVEKISVSTGGMSINDTGADFDVRIEGDTEQNLVYINAGLERVGIKTASPDALLHLKDTVSPARVHVECTAADSFPGFRLTNDARAYDIQIDGSSDALRFFDVTATSERMRIDSSGRLLLGTTTEGTGAADDFTIATTGSTGITVRSGTSSDGSLFFSDGTSGTDEYRGYIQYGHASNILIFGTDATEAMRINSSQNVGIGTNNPGQRLEVRQTSASHAIIACNRPNSDTFAIALGNNSGNNGVLSVNNTDLLFGKDVSGSFTEHMRIDTNGDVAIGTSTNAGGSRLLIVNNESGDFVNGSDAGLRITNENASNDTRQASIAFTVSTSGVGSDGAIVCTSESAGNSNLRFFTDTGNGLTEKMRINAAGSVLIAHTDFSNEVVSGSAFGITMNAGGVYVGRNVSGSATVNGFHGTQGTFQTMGDGDAQNTNNSYGAISDVSLKQDIVDAASQWDDIKNVRVRKFRFKDNPTGFLRIGVIAQEIETVSAGLVKEVYKDSTVGSTDNSTLKVVKYSVLYMKAIKALQEAMARIEVLETKVAALEAA